MLPVKIPVPTIQVAVIVAELPFPNIMHDITAKNDAFSFCQSRNNFQYNWILPR